MRLPNVLIIGAMKSGTTGLYMDLAEHPNIFLSDDKEPRALCSDEVLTEEGRKAYAAIYAKARPDQVLLDASTDYSKRPEYEGVVGRAVAVLPPDFKVIYLVRHPIERIVSHHHHESSIGQVSPDIEEAVRNCRRLVDYSRYAFQLEPWIEAIGRDRIEVVRFEDYVDRRPEVVAQLTRFLGLSPSSSSVDRSKVYNKSQGKPLLNRFWRVINHNSLYRWAIRPLLPVKLRLAIRKLLLPKASQKSAALTPETAAWLRGELVADVARLSELLGREGPLWDDF